MLFSALLTLCLANVVLTAPSKRAEGLIIELSGPSGSISSIDELKFTATVTNTGSETVKILKYATIMDDQLPTRSFVVTKDGASVPFKGIKLSVSMNDLTDDSFAIIPAGKTLTFQHDSVASLFDFASVGTGTFSFEPITSFSIMDSVSTIPGIKTFSRVLAPSGTFDVEIIGDISAPRSLPDFNKRALNICPDTAKKSFIDASYSESRSLATLGISYINATGANNTLYQAYWGALAPSNVTAVLNAVATENSNNRTLSCVDTFRACSAGVIAYTVTATTNIYFCDLFFNEVPTLRLCSGTTVTARNVRGGTTLHELTHAVAGTDDVTYGCAADQALSDAQSIVNADSYNCFTTQVFANTVCQGIPM